jgi:type IV pilus assembly protein PilE
MSLKRSAGFTLIELMIVVAIVAILAALAYPAYNRYGFRARRADGKEFLMRIAAAEERFFTTNNVYTSTIGVGGLGFTGTTSEQKYYTVAVALGAGSQSYTLTATPALGQTTDTCGNLVLSSAGNKTYSGSQTNGACW